MRNGWIHGNFSSTTSTRPAVTAVAIGGPACCTEMVDPTLGHESQQIMASSLDGSSAIEVC